MGGEVFTVKRLDEGPPPSLQSMLAYIDAESKAGHWPSGPMCVWNLRPMTSSGSGVERLFAFWRSSGR